MITMLARFEMLQGKEDEALAAVSVMAEAVKAHEPGALLFTVSQGQVNPLEIYIYEVYKDQEAFDAHRKTAHMREFQAAFGQTLDRASFNVEMLKQVAGFVRPAATA
ncbi:MAG: putative quinol monooxygenase [Dehalococcoidia bacterium]|nr:putative quinol monooxygenase [Dehalococcoidia bacterium]